MSGSMVRAILRDVDPKTQTRRVIAHFDGSTYALSPEYVRWQFNENNDNHHADRCGKWYAYPEKSGSSAFPVYGLRCPYGEPGDRLWVRETLRTYQHFGFPLGECPQVKPLQGRVWGYAADNIPGHTGSRTSIHAPRWASRIKLEVTGVRVERLQDIIEEDAKAEGVDYIRLLVNGKVEYRETPEPAAFATRPMAYRALWDSLNAARDDGKFAWSRNPWVWVVEFRRI